MHSKKKGTQHRKHAQEYGIDLSLLESNLKMAPSERVIAHQKALEFALLLRQAGEDARFSKNSPKAPGKSS